MQDELIAAAEAVQNYQARSEEEAGQVSFIRNCLTDAITRAAMLDDLHASAERAKAVEAANRQRAEADAALAAAQSA